MTRIDCPVCHVSVSLVCHGSGGSIDKFVRVHRSLDGQRDGNTESMCVGSGRWVPQRERVTA